MIPQLRFPEFTDNWVIATLEQLTSRIGDGIHSTPKYNNNGNYYFINGNNLVNGKIKIFETTKKVEESEAKKHNKELSNRTILLSINGTIGNLAFYNNEKVVLGKSAAYLNVKNEIDKEFIYNVLKISKTQNFFFSELTGSTIKNLSLKTIRETKISIPTLLEQTKIANFLTAVDKRINLLQKKKTELEQYKKGVMQKLFSQEIRFKQDDGSDFPDWEEKKLGEVCKVQGGFAFKSSKFKDSGIPVIRISNISNNNNFIDTSNMVYYEKIQNDQNYIIRNGDLLIAMSGATTGKTSIFNLEDIAYVNQRVGLFKSLTEDLFYPFITQFVLSSDFENQLNSLLVAGAQPNISSNDIESIKISYPSNGEQQKIANFLSSIDKSIEKLGNQIEQTQNWKQGLLQKMFV